MANATKESAPSRDDLLKQLETLTGNINDISKQLYDQHDVQITAEQVEETIPGERVKFRTLKLHRGKFTRQRPRDEQAATKLPADVTPI